MDFSQLPNPYDFANPVDDPVLFVGREQEIEEIKYYLNLAGKTSRPINLALIGSRASGKTSMLNMIEVEAKERGFCTVRLNLDEGDVATQLTLFYKIFDALLTEACSLGVYGGLSGKTYDVYCDVVSTYNIPNDSTFCPFIFPVRYAKAMGSGNVESVLPDTNFTRDITAIQKELQRPIILLFDECDVLSQSRVHLQKLRNIFMNVPGFMLVMTGTPTLFPVMDEVFSPIIRQFKKINIGPFSKRDETSDCILKPLEKVGVDHPSEIFDLETFSDVSEIHDLTAGRPYEIQLLCHFLFRRVQERRAKRMELTLDVLDDVLNELSNFQDISARPVLSAVRNLEKRQLAALAKLCNCNEQATVEQIWMAEYIFWNEREWTKESLQEHFLELVNLGILTVIKEGIISFAGDDFDRIYSKYLARKHGVNLAINDMPYEVFLGFICLFDFLSEAKIIGKLIFSTMLVGKIEHMQTQSVLSAMQSSEGKIVDNPFKLRPDLAIELYWSSIDFRTRESFDASVVTITTEWVTVRRWLRCDDTKESEVLILDELPRLFAEPAKRAMLLGASVEVEVHKLPVIASDTLYQTVLQSNDNKLMQRLGKEHSDRMIEAYIHHDDVEDACFHGELAYKYVGSPEIANNLGYVYLVLRKLAQAESLFEEALSKYDDKKGKALPSYNLGIVAAIKGDFQNALDRFNRARELIIDASMDERSSLRLVVPAIEEGSWNIQYHELDKPDLLETVETTISIIERINSQKQG